MITMVTFLLAIGVAFLPAVISILLNAIVLGGIALFYSKEVIKHVEKA
jgi:high-affinity K+ transport system ATPase subunit B